MRPHAFVALATLVAATGFAGVARAQDFVTFQAPSGNIACMQYFDGGRSEVRCDILEYSGRDPEPRPAWCDGDWGYAFTVRGAGTGASLCAGDTVMDRSAPVLGYGNSIDLGGVVCASATTGLTCRNAQGHGFTLSRASRTVF